MNVPVNVLMSQQVVLIRWNIPIDPAVSSEAYGVTYTKVKASIPMNDYQDIQNDTPDPECVWKSSSGLSFTEELIQTREAEETI